MWPMTRQKWTKASKSSRFTWMPNICGLIRMYLKWKISGRCQWNRIVFFAAASNAITYPMNPNWVSAMSVWLMCCWPVFTEYRLVMMCRFRTAANDFHDLKKIITHVLNVIGFCLASHGRRTWIRVLVRDRTKTLCEKWWPDIVDRPSLRWPTLWFWREFSGWSEWQVRPANRSICQRTLRKCFRGRISALWKWAKEND